MHCCWQSSFSYKVGHALEQLLSFCIIVSSNLLCANFRSVPCMQSYKSGMTSSFQTQRSDSGRSFSWQTKNDIDKFRQSMSPVFEDTEVEENHSLQPKVYSSFIPYLLTTFGFAVLAHIQENALNATSSHFDIVFSHLKDTMLYIFDDFIEKEKPLRCSYEGIYKSS